jgi:hypothetical protein
MVLYSERNPLPTWVSAARCAGKVRPFPDLGVSCADVILKWQDVAYSFSCWRARPRHLCCQSFIKGVRNSALPLIIRLISASRMSDNTLSTLMGNVPSRSVDSPKVNERGLCVSQMPSSYSYRCILLLQDLDAAFTRDIRRDSTSTGAPTVPTKAAAEADDSSTLSLSGLMDSLDGVAAADGR